MHPGAALIDCEDCKNFVYDLETGKRQTYRQGPDRKEVPQPRLPGMPLQCGKCPKKSPENAKLVELTAKNWKTYRLWREARATHGRCLTPQMAADSIVRRNLAVLDSVQESLDRTRQDEFMNLLAVRQQFHG